MVRETRHLWVANLPDNTREDRIREHFQRYGRVQSVKIITSGTVPSATAATATATSTATAAESIASDHHHHHHLSSSTSAAHQHHNHHSHHQNHNHHSRTHGSNTQSTTAAGTASSVSAAAAHVGSNSSCHDSGGAGAGVTSCNSVSNNVSSSNQALLAIGVCATIAFMDIKSASKAHLAEHKFEDRILTTEYYEPSAMQHLHGTASGNSSSESGTSSLVVNNKIVASGESDSKQDTHGHGRYASTSSHGSSDDHSPGYDRTGFYDRVSTSQIGSRSSETSSEYIRRNSYHSNDRGRQRDRQHFRNSPYSLIVDRSNQISHRLTSSTWYETSPSSSSSSRNHYANNQSSTLASNASSVFQQPDSSYDRHNSSDLSDHQTSSPGAVTTSNNTVKDSVTKQQLLTTTTPQPQLQQSNAEAPYKPKLLVNNHHHHHHHHHRHSSSSKSIKSRSGSESPISNRSSRSHSRSPSSCSSTHSSSHTTTPTSSRDSNSSPISGNAGDLLTQHNSTPSSHHRSRHSRHHKGSASKSLSGSSHNSQRHRRNLQASLASTGPLQSIPTPAATAVVSACCIDKPASTSSLSSTGSFSGSNSLGFYSEDNRPLAICVRNLPLRSSDTSLKDGLFHEYKKHGKVTWVKVVGQNHDRYALVCFKKPEDVDKALEVSQDKLFFGCKIEVQSYQGYDVDDNEFRPYEAELDEYQPKSTRTLFIGNLEKDITVAELRRHFECFGEILEIDIKKQGSTPYAFCQYADIVSVVKAVRKMDGEHLGSTRIKLGFGKSMPTPCVWFDGIAESVTEHYLSQSCSRFGVVQKVTIDRERRMALVTFDQIPSAQTAVKEMRGTPMRGRKLQVDFASRECIDAFYGRLEKHSSGSAATVAASSATSTAANNSNCTADVSTIGGTTAAVIGSGSNSRYLSSLSRSRASSFSRPGNQLSGTASPTSTPSAGSTPRHLSTGGASRKFRYAAGSPELFYDSNEYLDAYSNYDHDRGIDSDHANANDGEATVPATINAAAATPATAATATATVTRRTTRCDKSPAGDSRQVQRGESEGPGRRRCERSPGEMRILESQRHKILDQLEKCPSSGDEAESPKKRAKYSHELDDHHPHHHHHNNHHHHHHNQQQPQQESSTTANCNGKVLDHREHSVASYATYNHHHRYHHSSDLRKTVEIRRLSDCNIKHSASVPGGAMTGCSNYTKPTRRPSTDSLSRYSAATTQMESYQLHKRRKTSAGASTSSSSSSSMTAASEMVNDSMPSTKTNSRTHPIQSFDDDGAESDAHGSRPDTPLFDERPDNAPADPRTNRPRLPREPLNLPLPKFAHGFHQQLRQSNQLLPASHATITADKYDASCLTAAFSHHSSLKHKSISPSPQHHHHHHPSHTSRSRSNSIMPPASSGGSSSMSETLLTSPRPPSLTSNSSDSEQELSSIAGPSTSPSLEERLKKLTEDYDSWSSNGRSSSSSHYMNNTRHAVPEIPIPETPELLLKNVLKNSMFDEDSKRLENINTQPPTTPSASAKSNFGSFGPSVHLSSVSGTSSPLVNMSTIASSAAIEHTASVLTKIQIPAQQQQQQPAIATMLQQRLGSSSGSPMHSPNTASPYNSPNPSSASSISSLKGLQYPFPSHPTTNSSSSSNIPAALNAASANATSSSSSPAPCATTISTTSSAQQQQKPKTCTSLSKSISLQEPASGTNNHNNNNFNASFNKSSTNNLNNNSNNNHNDSPATTPSSSRQQQQLVKSVSLPASSSSSSIESVKGEKIDESESETLEASKVENCRNEDNCTSHAKEEKKNHAKERRKNSEHDSEQSKEEAHAKKESSGFRKEKESKRMRDRGDTTDEKKIKSEPTAPAQKTKKSRDESNSIEEKKEEERAPSPNVVQRKRQMSVNDEPANIDSSLEITVNHVHEKRENKHTHESKNNSKHHHHAHKERKNSLKVATAASEKQLQSEDDSHSKSKQQQQQNDVHSSKDSIFDELKRNSKENIIKANDKVHKNKSGKHHHHHRDNGTKDKENQTQIAQHHYNNDTSAIMADDVINRSSEDDSAIALRHSNNGRKPDHGDEHEAMANHKSKHDDHHHHHHHQQQQVKSSDENHVRAGKKCPRRSLLNTSISTDETEDSDGNSKRVSFFDIPDDGPNISMYDKVKARSCKNLKKQEEEKKIKDKFTALKQSRAKREKKRLNTSEDDSDSDIHDTNSNDMFTSTKYKKSHLSASDDDMHDSDDEILSKKSKNRTTLSICDDESSESGINVHDGHRKRNKFFNRKSSRSNVIDSSDEEHMSSTTAKGVEGSADKKSMVEIKQEPAVDSFDELKKQEHDASHPNKNNKHSSKKRHHEKANKEEKASKKSKKLSKEHHRKSTSSTDSMQKREEDIFGSVSEEDEQQPTQTSNAKVESAKSELPIAIVEIKKEKIDESVESAPECAKERTPREESKKRKEKRERRREREKQRIIKEEENSVDLDEAGRALEAQLMSDSDHKINNNEIQKELKTDDVFNFTDDDIKRDHHDLAKKKKKKKRTKEERKHHHNHHHYETAEIKQEPIDTESSGTFNNNNNNSMKMKLEVVIEDVKLKPSVPSLIDDVKVEVQQASASLLSPVKKEAKQKPEVTTTIPGFGGVPIDEKVHEKAVMSIAAELEKKSEEVAQKPIEVVEKKQLKPEVEKPEEKSRVVISQEETEDAVAALLGESFGMTHEDPYNDYEVPIVTTDAVSMEAIEEPAVIPPEEDEEMKKAIMSLNSEIERKIDTPQSEHDLQIDTDTEEPVEDENISGQQLSFDEPPKTPEPICDVPATPEKEKLDSSDASDKSLKIDENPRGRDEEEGDGEAAKIEKKNDEPKKEEETKPEIKDKAKTPEKESPQKKPHASHPTSITIPTEQAIATAQSEKNSPRKQQQQSPGAIRQPPIYSPITPLSGKDPQTMFTPNAIANPVQKLPTTVSTPLSTQSGPKITGIPGKTDAKPNPVHSSNVTASIKLPSPVQQQQQQPQQQQQQPQKVIESKEQNIQVIPKYTPVTAAERKMEVKQPPKVQVTQPPPPQQQNIRQPQILYPPPVVEAKEKQHHQHWQQNSVIQKVVDAKESELSAKVEKKEAVAALDTSHEEEDNESTSPDNSIEKESAASKKNRSAAKQRGRKVAAAPVHMSPSSPPQPQPSQQVTHEEIPSSPQTRRGAKTAAATKRGRGGKAVNAKATPPTPVSTQQQPMQLSGMRQQKTSESDVYEFHDDSGEELVKSGDARPRLIMTIKSTAATTVTPTPPVVTQTTIIQTPVVSSNILTVQPQTSITPIVTTAATVVKSPSPSLQPQVVSETQHDVSPHITQAPSHQQQQQQQAVPQQHQQTQQQVPSPAHSDEFAQPGNTRKSKRLLEKDGPRTSVDDTIDDVIRNSNTSVPPQPLPINSRTTRVTRQNAAPHVNVPTSNATTLPPSTQQIPQAVPTIQIDNGSKKQTRPNSKKQKDRKTSETSESESEKKVEKPQVINQLPTQQQLQQQQQQQQPPPTSIPQQAQPVISIEPAHQLPPPPTPSMSTISMPVVQIQPQEPAKIIQVAAHPMKPETLQAQPKRDGAELLQLIDPVTGELQKMTQSKEGQYVPVSENKIQAASQQQQMVVSQQQSQSQQQTIYHVESKPQEDKKIISISTAQNVIKTSTPVIIEPPKVAAIIPEQSNVIKPVITQNPQATAYKPVNKYIYSTQNLPKAPTTVVSAMPSQQPTVISTQTNLVKTNVSTGIVHQPSTIYNLPNIIPPSAGNAKYISQPPMATQKTIVMPNHSGQPTTIIHSTSTNISSLPPQQQQQQQQQQQPQPKPQIIHQKIPSSTQPQIVIHPQTHQIHHPQQTPSGSLMISIPPSSTAQSVPSPSRMAVKQVIQRTVSAQQQQQSSPQMPPTVVIKSTQPPPQSVSQQQHHTIMTSQDIGKSSARTTYIPPGTKIVEGPIAYGANREVIFVEGKHTMYPNYQTKYQQAVPSPTQQKPPQQQIVQQIPIQAQQQQQPPQQSQQTSQQQKMIEKIVGQPQVSVQHIPHQQKVYITGPVITTTQPPMQSSESERQQWLAHDKLKARYMMDFEEGAARSQQQQQASPHLRKPAYVIETSNTHPPQPHHPPSSVVSHQGKTIIGLNQAPQILTGAVASPPLKAHMSSQQPIVTGASSSRIAVPSASPKDQHLPQRHYPPEAYEEVMQHGDRTATAYRSQSPPPAHQTSPLTTRPPYMMTTKLYPQPTMYMRSGEYSRLPMARISGHPGAAEEVDEPRSGSPLELRRTASIPLQSPSDRITDSPMMAPHYLSPRIPQPYFYDSDAIKSLPNAEPPPAHRSHALTAAVFAPQQGLPLPPPPSASVNLAQLQREREEQRAHQHEKDDAVQIVYSTAQGPPAPLIAPVTNPRSVQLATPPIASQVPPHADTLTRLLERYPPMWQGLLALKTEQAAVQMHFVHGNKKIAKASLPFNPDHTTPPLRIAQRMRLEPSQIDGVARKMMIDEEHCVLLALPCGFNYSDVMKQTENLQVSFINYLQLKQAAGIINIADSGSQNASYVVHIFPSCDFANDSLTRIAPDLMHKVNNIAYLLIVIATV